MINVLQLISPTGFYGAERWVLALANSLPKEGIRCDLAITSESPSSRFEIIERYPQHSGEVHRIELQHRFDIKAITRLAALLRDHHIDVLHTHGYKSDAIGLLAGRLARVPVISTPHGFSVAPSLKQRIYRKIGDACLRRMCCVVPLSEQLALEVQESGVAPKKVRVILNGVDTDAIDVADAYSIEMAKDAVMRIGYVGQLIERKRVHLIVELFERIRGAGLEVELHIIGDGPQRPQLDAMKAASRWGASMQFHGFVAQPLSYVKAFDLMVMTSKAEGIPRSLMEAMYVGVPCVAFAIDGMNELIEDDVSGALVPDGDLDLLVTRCTEILNSSVLRQSLSLAAQRRIATCFSAQRMAREYTELYREIVGSDPKPPKH